MMKNLDLITAEKARAELPAARLKKIDKAIRYAIAQGDYLCFVRFRLNDDELSVYRGMGFQVTLDSNGSTFLYWFKKN